MSDWGSSGRRFKSRQPDTVSPTLSAGVSMRSLAAVEALTPRAGHPGLIPYRDGRLVHQTVGSEYQEAVE